MAGFYPLGFVIFDETREEFELVPSFVEEYWSNSDEVAKRVNKKSYLSSYFYNNNPNYRTYFDTVTAYQRNLKFSGLLAYLPSEGYTKNGTTAEFNTTSLGYIHLYLEEMRKQIPLLHEDQDNVIKIDLDEFSNTVNPNTLKNSVESLGVYISESFRTNKSFLVLILLQIMNMSTHDTDFNEGFMPLSANNNDNIVLGRGTWVATDSMYYYDSRYVTSAETEIKGHFTKEDSDVKEIPLRMLKKFKILTGAQMKIIADSKNDKEVEFEILKTNINRDGNDTTVAVNLRINPITSEVLEGQGDRQIVMGGGDSISLYSVFEKNFYSLKKDHSFNMMFNHYNMSFTVELVFADFVSDKKETLQRLAYEQDRVIDSPAMRPLTNKFSFELLPAILYFTPRFYYGDPMINLKEFKSLKKTLVTLDLSGVDPNNRMKVERRVRVNRLTV